MKNFIQIVLAVVAIAGMTGCATPRAYFTDRGHDAADIFSCSVGRGGGAMVRISGFTFGLGGEDEPSFGLRGGRWYSGLNTNLSIGSDYMLFFGEESFDPGSVNARRKFFHATPYGWHGEDWGMRLMPPVGCVVMCLPVAPLQPVEPAPSFYTQIEVAGGIGFTVRIGFNPGELLDFVFGWFGVDIFDDDLEAKHANRKSNHVPEDAELKLADPQH